MRTKKQSRTTNTTVKILSQTRQAIEKVREEKRWNLQVTVDEVFKDYIQRHGIGREKVSSA